LGSNSLAVCSDRDGAALVVRFCRHGDSFAKGDLAKLRVLRGVDEGPVNSSHFSASALSAAQGSTQQSATAASPQR
jgi:hypothetical protein